MTGWLKRPGILFYVPYLISVLSGAAGFISSRRVPEIILFLSCSVIRAVLRKRGESTFLVLSAGFAALGLLQGAPPLFMYLYMGLSLACYDIVQMEMRTSGNGETPFLHHYRLIRFYPMMISVFTAFLAAMILKALSLSIPFFILLFLSISGFFLINRIIHSIKEK